MLEAVGLGAHQQVRRGLPGRRYYGGCESVDEVEQLAIDRAKELFGADHANVQPHAGAPANHGRVLRRCSSPATRCSALQPRPRRAPDARAARSTSPAATTLPHYGVRREDRADRLRRGAAAGAGAPAQADRRGRLGLPAGDRRGPVPRDRRRGRRAADGRHGALRGAGRRGAAPQPGRVRGRRHLDDPQDAAPAPARGWCCAAPSTRTKIDKAVFPGLQGGPLCHVAAAKAVCFKLAASRGLPRLPAARSWRTPRRWPTLIEADGAGLTGGTDTHLRAARPAQQSSGRARTPRTGCTRCGSPPTATRCRSTSGRRRSPRACASARRRRRCGASTRTTRARSGAIILRDARPGRRPPGACRPHAAICWPPPALRRGCLGNGCAMPAERCRAVVVWLDHPLVQRQAHGCCATGRTTIRTSAGWPARSPCCCLRGDARPGPEPVEVETPLERMHGPQVRGKKVGWCR